MNLRPKSFAASPRIARFAYRLGPLCAVLLLGMSLIPRANAGATLLLEEPYSYDGTFAGTGHVAVYLSHVCSSSPVSLRVCRAGETGVVLSRYDGIGGYDWVAIPFVSYLYAVERPEAIPLVADAKLVAFLRDQYRRDHLETLAPDRPDGSAPQGNWYQMVGASYDRTIYAFEIETSAEQDARLIQKLNDQPNRERYNFVKRNCADFVREVVNFYYPHALHRSVIGDLGVTTPKQIAKMLAKYSEHHPQLESSDFLIPQVPGAVRRSKPVHGVLESVLAAKKYMIPLVVLHPYIGGGLLVEYFGHRRFDPARGDMVLDSQMQLSAPLTRHDRAVYQSRLDEMSLPARVVDPANDATLAQTFKENKGKEMKDWERIQASASPGFDGAGEPLLQVPWVEDRMQVGLSRGNILSSSGAPELAAALLEARLRQELRPATTRKTSKSDVEKDLALLRQMRSPRRAEVATLPSAAHSSRALPAGTLQ